MLMLPPNAHCGKVQTFNISEIDSCFVDHKNTRKQLGYKLILNALQIPIPARTFCSIICTTTQLYFAEQIEWSGNTGVPNLGQLTNWTWSMCFLTLNDRAGTCIQLGQRLQLSPELKQDAMCRAMMFTSYILFLTNQDTLACDQNQCYHNSICTESYAHPCSDRYSYRRCSHWCQYFIPVWNCWCCAYLHNTIISNSRLNIIL